MPESHGHSLFFFGTLMDPDVLGAALGRQIAPSELIPAVLTGWHRTPMAGMPYPMVVPRRGARVEGMVSMGLTAEDCRRLDHYEGPDYLRTAGHAALDDGRGIEVVFYTCRQGVVAGQGEWRLGDWQRRHKKQALVRIGAMMAQFDRRQ